MQIKLNHLNLTKQSNDHIYTNAPPQDQGGLEQTTLRLYLMS